MVPSLVRNPLILLLSQVVSHIYGLLEGEEYISQTLKLVLT